MEIDLTKISEGDWDLLCQIKQISLGCWKELSEISSILSKGYRVNYPKIYGEVMQWASWRFMSVCDKSCDAIKAHIALSSNLEEGFCVWMEANFDCGDDCWHRKVPKGYRYVKYTWWQDIWYGASLFAYFNNNLLLLGCYGLVNRLEHAPLGDIAELWEKYNGMYQQLLSGLDCLYARSWWWHWAIRECILELRQSLRSKHQEILGYLKERLGKKENSLVLLTLFVEEGFYESLFCQLWDENECEKILHDWQLYYPKWMVVYQLRSSQVLRGQKEAIEFRFWGVYFKQCLLDAGDSAYLYGRLIEKLLGKGSHFAIPFIKEFFPKTMSGYSEFWYQLKDWVGYNNQGEVLQCLEGLFSHWLYEERYLVQLSLDRIELSRVGWGQYKWIVSQYNQTLSIDTIKRFKIALGGLLSQMRMVLGFQRIKEAQIEWRSVDLVFNFPVSTIAYAQSLQLCFLTHQYLSKDARVPLQAYMVTAGRYAWVRRWGVDELDNLIKELGGIQSEVWQQGLILLRKDIKTQLNNRSIYGV